MEKTSYIWQDGKFVAWDDARVHVLTHGLHYGGGAFEGIRFYETPRGPAIFRLREHIDRLLYSCRAIKLAPLFSAEQLCEACVETVRRNGLRAGYLRPLVFFGYGKMGLNPSGAPTEAIIACWSWGQYLPHAILDVKISSYIRIHPRSTVADAKLVGHYVNSILASEELHGTNYHEALFLDFEGNVAEGPGENIFLVKDGQLLTPKLGTILPGITRSTVMQLAQDSGIAVQERQITKADLLQADEAFFTGTAVEVALIRSIDGHLVGSGETGPLSSTLKTLYGQVVRGSDSRYGNFLTFT